MGKGVAQGRQVASNDDGEAPVLEPGAGGVWGVANAGSGVVGGFSWVRATTSSAAVAPAAAGSSSPRSGESRTASTVPEDLRVGGGTRQDSRQDPAT